VIGWRRAGWRDEQEGGVKVVFGAEEYVLRSRDDAMRSGRTRKLLCVRVWVWRALGCGVVCDQVLGPFEQLAVVELPVGRVGL
jgi:hypothetical protein